MIDSRPLNRWKKKSELSPPQSEHTEAQQRADRGYLNLPIPQLFPMLHTDEDKEVEVPVSTLPCWLWDTAVPHKPHIIPEPTSSTAQVHSLHTLQLLDDSGLEQVFQARSKQHLLNHPARIQTSLQILDMQVSSQAAGTKRTCQTKSKVGSECIYVHM